jgi:hypothetical protein
MIDKALVMKNIIDELKKQQERKRIYAVVTQVLETWDGKKLTKRIENDISARLLEYNVSYYHDKPYWKKVTIVERVRFVHREQYREEITLHHDSHGEYFSLVSFLDGHGYQPQTIHRISELQSAINNQSLLDDLDSTLEHFAEQLEKFKERMGAFRPIIHNLDRDSKEFFQKHNL